MIISITYDWGYQPAIVRIQDTVSTLAQVSEPNYLENEKNNIRAVNNGDFDWETNPSVLVAAVDGNALFTLSPDQKSLIPQGDKAQSTQNVTALAGGGQTGATQLNNGNNVVANVASANDSVVLPSDANGKTITVTNTSANSLNVYPSSGESINSLAVNAPLAVAPGATTVFYGVSDTNYRSK